MCDRGLAWHTDDQTLRTKFEEYGQVDEAVRPSLVAFSDESLMLTLPRSSSRIATPAAVVASASFDLPRMPLLMQPSKP